jgi:acetyl-CoA acyltransferase 1
MQRLNSVNRHFAKDTSYNGGAVGPKRDDDVVIIGFARTAMTRAKRGPQKDTGLEAMLKPCLEKVASMSGIDKGMVEDIVIGNVLNPGSAATNARMAMFMAGYPETTSVTGINRLCSSGLQAVATVANAIRAGQISCGIGGGFESMTNANMSDQVNPNLLGEEVFDCEPASNCLMPMGITSENVAAEFGVDRATQDAMAVESHRKAAAAQAAGLLQAEITPYQTIIKNKDGEETKVTVDKDDGIRANTTAAGLAKLKPAFQKNGTTTAGNSS